MRGAISVRMSPPSAVEAISALVKTRVRRREHLSASLSGVRIVSSVVEATFTTPDRDAGDHQIGKR